MADGKRALDTGTGAAAVAVAPVLDKSRAPAPPLMMAAGRAAGHTRARSDFSPSNGHPLRPHADSAVSNGHSPPHGTGATGVEGKKKWATPPSSTPAVGTPLGRV
jgi:hypothetical protein